MKTSEIAGDILILLAAAYTLYLTIVMVRRIRSVVLKNSYRKVFAYELIACAVLTAFALDMRFGFFTRFGPPLLKATGWLLRIAVVLATAVLLCFMGKITAGSFIRQNAPARYAIVLGLALENGKPAEDLLSRLDTAAAFVRENTDAALILTGGNPDGSGKTEAAVMRELLLERGVADAKMVLEDQAKTTGDNFRNTAGMLKPDEPVVLISSDYHMDRAVQTAGRSGFTRIIRRPAPSSFRLYGANVMWETIMELNELTLKQ